MRVIFVLITIIASVTALKCKTSVDLAIRWTVDCSAMDLSSAPPAMIVHPVVALNMSHNSLVRLNQSQFINWTDISVLDISSNKIREIDENSFKELNNLTELFLMNNYIEVLSLNITKYLVKLRILNMSFNKLKLITPNALDATPLLYKVYLSHNIDLGKGIFNINALKIPVYKNLIALGIENISLNEIPSEYFGKATHLIYLNLASNPLRRITDLPVSLRYLNISGTLISTISQDLFSKLQLIQKLSLESMPLLKEIKANSFSCLRNIEELYVRNCSNLSIVSENVFGESHIKLKKVTLSHCAITTLPKNFEQVFNKVEYLDLQGNPWTCDSSISWILNMKTGNQTSDLRCKNPPSASGMRMVDYFKPRTLHPHTNLIRAAILLMLVAVLVASVVAMVRQMSKQKAKTYRQLNDIRLEDRVPKILPPL